MVAPASDTAAARPHPILGAWEGLRRMPAGNIIIVFVLVQVVLIIAALIYPDDFRYLSRPNILIMLRAIPTLGIVALRVGLLMVAGEFDLSAGSVFGLTTYVLAIVYTDWEWDRVKLTCFMLSSLAATVSGVLSLARVHSVTPAQGFGIELKAITICVIGGLFLMGGRGTIIGIFIGACLFYTVEDVLLLIRAPGHFLDLFIGAVIVVAVIMNTWASRSEDRQ